MLGHRLLGLLFNYFSHDMYSQATPGQLNASNCSKQKLDYSFLYLLVLKNQFSAIEDAHGCVKSWVTPTRGFSMDKLMKEFKEFGEC